MSDKTEQTTATNSEQPLTETSKGGKGARQRRNDARRKKNNVSKTNAIKTEMSHDLGLTESDQLSKLNPASSIRNGGAHINLLGYLDCVRAMLKRMRTIAHRPLSNTLTAEAEKRYLKVAIYIASARIVSAQDKLSCVAGNELDVKGTITLEEFRKIDGYCETVPRFLAWLLSHIGNFEYMDVKHTPLIPNSETEVGIHLYTGGFYDCIHSYVAAYAENAVPAAERPTIVRLQGLIPETTLNQNNRFTAAAVQFWTDQPTEEDWESFVEINSAAKDQMLNVTDFTLTAANGTPVPIVRFPVFGRIETLKYYSLTNVPSPLEKAALVLRLGIDEWLPIGCRDRFIGNPETALMLGFDLPRTYLTAQLAIMSKANIRSD